MTDTTNSGTPAADQSDQTAAAAQDMQQEQQAPVTQEEYDAALEQKKRELTKKAVDKAAIQYAISKDMTEFAADYPAEFCMMLSGDFAKRAEKIAERVTTNAELLKDALLQIAGKMLDGFSKIDIEAITNFIETRKAYIGELTPYLEKELEQLHAEHPETAGITLDEISASFDLAATFDDSELEELKQEFENDPDKETDPVLKNLTLVFIAITKAKQRYAADKGENPEARKPLQIGKADISEIIYPIDKVNSVLWGIIEKGTKEPIKAESDKDSARGRQANIYVILDFEEIPGISISRKLGMYDKRVFIATANLAKQGHIIVTTSQIYKQMGNKGRPSAADREKILKSLEFMSLVRVYLDNTEEAKLYTKYERVKGNFYLLATQSIQGCEINGMPVDDAIQILEPPMLFDFAEKRGQITTAPIELLESPISKTEANLLLEDYLFTRIARMKKNKDVTRTILLETIYKNCKITTKMQKSRLPEKIQRILNHYKESNWIKGYTLTERSIEIVTYKA